MTRSPKNRICLRGETEARESKERGGSRSRGDRRERGGKRVHESTARAPPKYAFRPKDPHFEIDPHDFPGIYTYIYIHAQHPQSRLVPPLFTSVLLSRPRSSNRTGSPRNATREFLESGSHRKGKTRDANDAKKN